MRPALVATLCRCILTPADLAFLFRHLTQTISLIQRTSRKRGWSYSNCQPRIFLPDKPLICVPGGFYITWEVLSLCTWAKQSDQIVVHCAEPNPPTFRPPLLIKVSKNFKKCRAHLVQKNNLSSRHFPTRFVNDQSANIVNNLSICEVNEAKLSTI